MPRGLVPLMTGGAVMNSACAAAASASAAMAAATRCLMRGAVSQGNATPSSPPPPGMQPPFFNFGSTPSSPPPPGIQPPIFHLQLADEVSPTPSSPPPGFQPPILRLADAITEPCLGSPKMPTQGSAGHLSGNCMPCAFFYTKGCGNGTQCSFCHLCPAGEKKRRQKEKAVLCRELKRMGLVQEA